MTRWVLFRCDSTGDLYPVTAPSPIPHVFLISQHTWHQHLGHPGSDVLRRLVSNNVISCKKEKPPVLCHACQLGKHVRLLFVSSKTIVSFCFDIVHSDVWTSPIPSLSGFQYYVLFLDHSSQFVWVYLLVRKSDVVSKFILFRNYVRTQFKCEIRAFQCDHGGGFDNRNLHDLFNTHGIQFRFSCPKTSQQNSKSERMVRTLNNIIRTLLFQAKLPPTYWVEALHMAVHILNILPSTTINNEVPFTRLFGTSLDYSLLRTFGCLCYPHLYPNHKLEPRATPSLFLGHASNHRGYRCLNLTTNKIIISRHVTFDETVFSYGSTPSTTVFRHKYLVDGTLSRYKARLVANGSTQLEGVDIDETFSPVVKLGTIRIVLSLAASRHWPVHQLDVKNAFLHGDLSETIISSLHQEFAMTDLGSLNYFLGMSITRDSSGMFLSQKKYVVEILKRAGMVQCNPSRTPVDTESKLGITGDVVCLHMHDPRETHFSALKRILRYVRGYCIFLGNNLLSWSAKRQPTLSYSSAEVEYHGVANAVAETCWLRNLLRELHTPLSSATLVYCDNVSAFYLSSNPVQHQRMKHIEIDIHFVRNLVATGQVWVIHVPSRYQYAYIFTKGLPTALFEEFCSSLSVRCPLAQTAEEC
ncbi:ribonuclease H-like domain-containing protein [Tanacetum coccineum]